MAKPAKHPAKPAPGQMFMSKLRGTNEFPLKRIARALYAATGERQDSLFQRLRNGQVTASAYWPGPSDLIDLPTKLWHDIAARRFKVRTHQRGAWKSYNYTVPAALLVKHIVIPKLVALGTDSAGTKILDAIRLLDTQRTSAEVVVTLLNAKRFSDDFLGPVIRKERRGRNRTSDTELLLVEMFRRLHLVPAHQLPLQKAFAATLTSWWNSDPDRPPRGEEWVLNYAKLVWAALKASPTA